MLEGPLQPSAPALHAVSAFCCIVATCLESWLRHWNRPDPVALAGKKGRLRFCELAFFKRDAVAPNSREGFQIAACFCGCSLLFRENANAFTMSGFHTSDQRIGEFNEATATCGGPNPSKLDPRFSSIAFPFGSQVSLHKDSRLQGVWQNPHLKLCVNLLCFITGPSPGHLYGAPGR